MAAPSIAFGTTEERRAFHYFRERTTWELSGFYESDFWNRIILQAAHSDPGIRHAVAALSSLHERFEKTGEVDTSPGDFALKQYNLAITKHLDALTQPDKTTQSVDTYLASCMIFICIELLQGHFVSASQLIQGAIQLLYENHSGSKVKSAWPFEVFEALLCHLQTQCVGLFGPSARPKVYEPRFMSASRRAIPKKFESIMQARDFWDYYAWHFSFADPSSTNSQVDHKSVTFYIDVLNQWTAAFDSLLTSLGSKLSRKDQCAVHILKIRQFMGSLSIATALRLPQQNDGQVQWDTHYHRNDDQAVEGTYENTFSQVVTMAEQVAELSGSQEHRSWKTNKFTLDYGLVSPMYDVARKCRDPLIRRRAINVLYANPCREALWDGAVAARIAERVILMEENTISKVEKASDIPASARVAHVVPTFVSDNKGPVVSYVSQADSSNTGKTVRELVVMKPANESGRILSTQPRSSPCTKSPASSTSPTSTEHEIGPDSSDVNSW